MRLLGAFLLHEARTQLRSVRFRVVGTGYVAAATAPAVVLHLLHSRGGEPLGAGTYAAGVSGVQPFLSALVGAIVAVDGLSRERDDGSLAVVGLAPLGNTGYLVRRYLALVGVLVPLLLLPPATAALLAWLDSPRTVAPGLFAWPWLVHTLPLTLAATAFALGMGTIAQGAVKAAILGLLGLSVGFVVLDSIHLHWHRHIEVPLDWLGLLDLEVVVILLGGLVEGWDRGITTTDAAHDVSALLERWAAPRAWCLGVGGFVLALGSRFLGRTRPDLRPWPAPPGSRFPTFVAIFNRLREEHSPDPAPGLADRLFLGAGLFALVLAGLHVERRWSHYDRLARTRYEVELSGLPEPTSTSVVPVRARLAGALGADGSLRTRFHLTVANRGREPVSHLAFSLNAGLSVSLAGPPGEPPGPRLTRDWDRLAVDLGRPLGPGDERELALAISGSPVEVEFELSSSSSHFIRAFDSHLRGRLSPDVGDLSRSTSLRMASPRRVSLAAQDLLPVPRYRPWTLEHRGSTEWEKALGAVVVPPELVAPVSDVSIDLAVPPGVLVADTCGNLGQGSAIRGTCRTALLEYAIRGGPMRPQGAPGAVKLAALPGHEAALEAYRDAFEEVRTLARRAWPGLDTLERLVVLEWPPDPYEVRRRWWGYDTLDRASARALLLVPERRLLAAAPVVPEEVAATAVAKDLLALRPLESREVTFFRKLYRVMVRSRMGVPEARRADLRGPIALLHAATGGTLLEAEPSSSVWQTRLPALLVALEARLGARNIEKALDAFLRAAGGKGSLAELFARLAEASGVDPGELEEFRRDFIAGNAIPELRLRDVRFASVAGGFEVSGSVENLRSGVAVCPVVLRTEQDAPSVRVRVGPEAVEPFRLRATSRPRTLLLDPDGRCYRYSPAARSIEGVERVEYREER